MRSSSRNSRLAVLTIALLLVAGSSTSAHRRDEYLQAARLAIDPERVEIVVDLTPGVAVARQVIAELDADADGSITPSEGQAYAQRFLTSLALNVDGTALRVQLLDHMVPTIDAVLNGTGTLRVHAQAPLPRLGGGLHQLHYHNTHRPDIGVYLANALVPASNRVSIASQQRDVEQRSLTVNYMLLVDGSTERRAWLLVAGAAAASGFAIAWRRRTRSAARI